MTQEKRSSLIPHPSSLLWAAVLAAPLPVLWIIVRFGVNVPVEDQIDIGAFLVRTRGMLFPPLAELFVQHNESRKIFPRLIIFYLARLTNWNVKYEMAAQCAIVCVTVAAIWFLARRTVAERALPATAVSALVLLSPVQWWNWLFGIQIVVFIPMLMLTVALATAFSGRKLWTRTILAAGCCFVANYSYANGMLLWVLVAVALFGRGENRRVSAILFWVVAAALSIVAYFSGYSRPPVSPRLISPFAHPVAAARFVLAFLGHPLWGTNSLTPNELLGGIGVALFVLLVFRVGIAGLPWILIGSYAIISAAATAMGRLGFGDWAALEPRYTTFAIPLWVAIVMMAATGDRAGRTITAGGTAALLALHLIASVLVWPQIRESNRDRLVARTALQFCRVVPDTSLFTRLVYRDPAHAIPIITAVSNAGYLVPPLIASPIIRSAGPGRGEFEGVIRPGPRQYAMYGWAELPDGRPADSVLIARDGRVVALSERTIDRPDHPGHGWDLPVTTRLAEPGAVYNAYAYDTETQRAYPLAGSLRVGRR